MCNVVVEAEKEKGVVQFNARESRGGGLVEFWVVAVVVVVVVVVHHGVQTYTDVMFWDRCRRRRRLG